MNKFDHKNPNNMSRDTDKMKTTSQMQLNLTQKKFVLAYWGDRVESFKGIRSELPSDYMPKIDIKIIDKILHHFVNEDLDVIKPAYVINFLINNITVILFIKIVLFYN